MITLSFGRVFILRVLLTFFLFPLLQISAADEKCAVPRPVQMGKCEGSQVEFDLTDCIEPEEKKAVKTTCQGEKAVAILNTKAAQYTAIYRVEDSWGEVRWTLDSLTIKKNKLPLKKMVSPPPSTVIDTGLATRPSSSLPLIQNSKTTPVEKNTGETQSEPDAGEGKLTGNWGGTRNRLSLKGLNLGFTYGAEPSYNFRGGIEKAGAYMGKALFLIDQDLEKLLNWTGGSLHFGVLGTHGKGPSNYVGDSQLTSNLDALSTVRLYEAWYQQSVLEDSASFLLGMYDFNSEFYLTETAL